MGDVGDLICGQSPSTIDVNKNGIGSPYVTGPEQWDGKKVYLNKWTTAPKRFAPKESIFITVKGSGVGTLFPGVKAAIGRDIYAYIPDERYILNEYAFFALKSEIGNILLNAKGLIPGLRKAHILDAIIYLPDIKEQAKIIANAKAELAIIGSVEASIKNNNLKLEALNKSILTKAFRGELVPQDQNDEPASELLKRIKIERTQLEKLLKTKKKVARKKSSGKSKKMIIPVIDALKQSEKPLSAQQLLSAAGYPDSADTDQIEQFFLDVRQAINDMYVEKWREDDQDYFRLVG